MTAALSAGLSFALPYPVVGASAQTQAAAGAPPPLSSCWSSDNGYPELIGLSTTPSTVDVRRRGAWVTVTARAVDDGGPGPATGIHELGMYITGGLAEPTMRQQPDGSWVGRVRVPRGAKPGTHAVESVRLRDGATRELGHVRDYYREQLAAVGLGASFQVVSTADRRAPRLRWLRMSSTSVDLTGGPAHIRVRARVTDDLAGTSGVHLEAGIAVTDLTLRHGTHRDGIWGGTLTVPRWSETKFSPYQVYIGLGDRVGNDRSVYWDELERRGLPSHLSVTTRRTDKADPVLSGVTVQPSTVDLTAGTRTVTVTVHVSDRPAGIAEMIFWAGRMRRVAGDRHHGVWRGTATFDACVFGTRQAGLRLTAVDRAGNRVSAHPTVSVVNRNDIHPPYPHVVTLAKFGPTDPVTFAFKEDVVGVSADSAPVRPTGYGAGFGVGNPPAAVPGSWSCTTAADAPVDCANGPLRRATWTPAVPLIPGQDYGVDFNPEHVLDIRDLAGNPLDPYLRYEDEYAPTWQVNN